MFSVLNSWKSSVSGYVGWNMRNIGVSGCYRTCGSGGSISGIFHRLFTVPRFLELQGHSRRLGAIYLDLIYDRDDPNPKMVHARVDLGLKVGSQSRCLEPRDGLVAEVSWYGLSLDFRPSSHGCYLFHQQNPWNRSTTRGKPMKLFYKLSPIILWINMVIYFR
jgi:hypothetical protein